VLPSGAGITWFPWIGTRGVRTLLLLAHKDRIACRKEGLSLVYSQCPIERFKQHLQFIWVWLLFGNDKSPEKSSDFAQCR
jgi:hypothetical protein